MLMRAATTALRPASPITKIGAETAGNRDASVGGVDICGKDMATAALCGAANPCVILKQGLIDWRD
jgi:hypothetical protein